ncbi:MAG: hypothetical protein AAF585_21450 [Verrucomicrobiota bacterium]
MSEFLTKYPLMSFEPRQEAFSTPFLHNKDESVYLFHLSEKRTGIYGHLPEEKGKAFAVTWFDPLTGKWIESDEKKFVEGDWGAWLDLKRHKDLSGPTAIVVLEEKVP